MKKFKIILHFPDGQDEEQDEMFDTESEAADHAAYLCSCCRVGAETLALSNPGDYSYDDRSYEEPDYTVIEVVI